MPYRGPRRGSYRPKGMSRNKNASELGGAAGDSAAENRVQSGYSLGRDSGGEPLGDEPNRNRGREHARTTVRNACLHCAVLEPPTDSAIPSDVRLRRLPQRRLGGAIIGLFTVALPGWSNTLGATAQTNDWPQF